MASDEHSKASPQSPCILNPELIHHGTLWVEGRGFMVQGYRTAHSFRTGWTEKGASSQGINMFNEVEAQTVRS